jgi:hypothetical protein
VLSHISSQNRGEFPLFDFPDGGAQGISTDSRNVAVVVSDAGNEAGRAVSQVLTRAASSLGSVTNSFLIRKAPTQAGPVTLEFGCCVRCP